MMATAEKIAPSPAPAGEFRIQKNHLLLAGILAIAIFTRYHHLDYHAFHHDESLYAKYTWNLYQGQGHAYDPMQHGPYMFHSAALFMLLFGDTPFVLRAHNATMGIILILLMWGFRHAMRDKGALWLMLLFTLTPTSMYFSRFYREDTPFLFFTIGIPLAYVVYLATRKNIYLYLMVASFAGMFCEKENAFVTTLAYMIFATYYLVYHAWTNREKAGIWEAAKGVFDNHPFVTKWFLMVSLWGVFFIMFAAADIAKRAKMGFVWESYIHGYWFGVYFLFGLLMVLWVYVSGMYRRGERLSPTFMGLNKAFYQDSLVFLISFGVFFAIIFLLYTNFFFNLKGFWTGVYEWFRYWYNQHSIARIKGEFRYYWVLMALYETLTLVLVLFVLFAQLSRKIMAIPAIAVWFIGYLIIKLGVRNSHLPFTNYKEELFTNIHLWYCLGGLVFGTWVAFIYLQRKKPFESFLWTWFTFAFAIYGYLQEKVPWLVLHIVAPMLFIAALALRDLWEYKGWKLLKMTGQACIGFLLLWTVHNSFLLCWENEDNAVEQMVYVQTHHDIIRAVEMIDQISDRLGKGKEVSFHIQGDSAWPLSYYLRKYPIPYSEMVNADKPIFISDWEKKDDYETILEDYVGYRFQLRSWWIPPTPYWFSMESWTHDFGDIMNYLLYRKKFNPWPNKTLDIYGSKDFILWVHKDLDVVSNWKWVGQNGQIRVPVGAPKRKAVNEDLAKTIKKIKVTPFQTIGKRGTQNAMFDEPKGIVVGKDGPIYVVDTNNSRIQKFDSSFQFLTSWGAPGDGDGQFKSPTGITLGLDGNVYVSDTWNHRIQYFSPDGKFLGKLGDSSVYWAPKGLIFGPDQAFYVVVTGYHMIRKYLPFGTEVKTWGAKSENGGKGLFFEPVGIAIDSTNKVYIADTANKRIQIFDTNGRYLDEWAVDGWKEFYGEPMLAFDSKGRLFYTDSSTGHIGAFSPTGELLAYVGSAGNGPGQFSGERGLAFDSQDNLYVADTGNHRLQKFGPVSFE